MPRIVDFELRATDFPFRNPFKHAAAERRSSSSLFVRCRLDDGTIGFGETLPRAYVTGESRDDAFDLLRDRVLPHLVGCDFASLSDLIDFLTVCNGKAPADWGLADVPQTAAWCAVDLALLDAFGRSSETAVRLTDRREWPSDVRYSVVLSSDGSLKTMLKTRLFGIRQVKLKVESGSEVEASRRARRWLGRGCEVRADANMAWTVDEALVAMPAMGRIGVHSFEQPLPADDIDGLARLVAESGEGVMADESLNDADSLRRLIERKACTAVNVRVAKCGGLVAALARCREALDAGLVVQIGCQVGESSLLSAAHLILVTAVERVTYAEGCFGHLLLREDPGMPVLQFGYGGRAPTLPHTSGLGIDIDPDILERWTVRRDTIE